MNCLYAIGFAGESAPEGGRLVAKDNAINGSLLIVSARRSVVSDNATYVGTSGQHKQSNKNDNHVQGGSPQSSDTALSVPSWAVFRFPHPEICHSPENKAEEGVKERAHEGEEIRKKWNDLGNDERQDPSETQNASP